MKIQTRNFLAMLFRTLPHFKGKYRLGELLVPPLTDYSCPEQCLVSIRMQDGSLMKLDLRSYLERKVFFCGEYDGGIIKILSSLIEPDSVIFDVGANIGLYSIALAMGIKNSQKTTNSKNLIWAFEPVPSNFARLEDAIKANNLETLVIPVNVALGNQDTEIQLHMEDKNSATTGNAVWVKEDLQRLNQANCSAKMMKLDDFAKQNNINRCDIIKVDIEGAEMEFILGGINFLERTRPIIYGEFNPFWVKHFGYSLVDIANIFLPWQYKIYQQLGRKNFVKVTDIKEGISDVLLIPQEKLSKFNSLGVLS